MGQFKKPNDQFYTVDSVLDIATVEEIEPNLNVALTQ